MLARTRQCSGQLLTGVLCVSHYDLKMLAFLLLFVASLQEQRLPQTLGRDEAIEAGPGQPAQPCFNASTVASPPWIFDPS
jgi:hypothetical protein